MWREEAEAAERERVQDMFDGLSTIQDSRSCRSRRRAAIAVAVVD